MAVCNNSCINLQTDLAHCGACGTKCAGGEVCSAGKCALSCQVGLTICNNTCVNTQKDASHCGKCATKCTYGTVCSGGSCQASCGNTVVDAGEQCDGSVPAGVTCASLGNDGGSLTCTSKCAFDTSKCHRCGDGVVSSPPEECDGAAFAGKTCGSMGYTGGNLACIKCKVDTGTCALPDACGKPGVLDVSKGNATVKMSTSAASNTVSLTGAGCTGYSTPGPELFYSVKLVGGFSYKITLTPESTFDAALYLFSDCASVESSCVAGKDTIGTGKVETVTVVPAKSGTYLVAVDSWSATAASGKGAFTLKVELLSPGKWVTLNPGAFMMGPPSSEACRTTNEFYHQVLLTNKYEISNTEVTQSQYKTVMGFDPSYYTACGDQCPVERVTWSMAAAYCNALSKLMGHKECYTCTGTEKLVSCTAPTAYETSKVYTCPGYRLPTEAEWERAYRGGAGTAYYNGGSLGYPACTSCTIKDPKLDIIAWYCFNGALKTHPVGLKAANNIGLHDMAGNVWELTSDVYLASLGTSPQTDPWGGSTGTDRVLRGGSYNDAPYNLRASYRLKVESNKAYYNVGFRCVRTVK